MMVTDEVEAGLSGPVIVEEDDQAVYETTY